VAYRWWRLSAQRPYVVTRIDGVRILLHRFLMGLESGDPREVDHRDGNQLDNRRANLRVCTHRENGLNITRYRSRRPLTSRYRGVSWNAPTGKWTAKFAQTYLGRYESEERAAEVVREHRRQLGNLE
jgi:hypothetical protein